ncbi:MAG: methyltransferase domain-containing protein [Candidatus Dormibacteria bacterium]
MDTVIDDIDWEPHAAGLAAQLVTQGVLADPTWATAFARTPRHLFTPRVLGDDGALLLAGQRRWLEAVYRDTALLTQTAPAGDGEQELPTSSSSKPAVMAVMLDRLNIHPGHRVLEIGTGTGYNTALLCHRLGEGNVYSIDIHPGLIEAAGERLGKIGCSPCLTTGDGAQGWAGHAPFDRILATCAITQIPPEWIRQLTDGGRIVAPLDAGPAGPLLVLDKTAHDEVTGRIDPYPAWFMPLRQHTENPLGPGQATGFTTTAMAHYGTTTLDPASLLAHNPDLALFLWLHLPALRVAGDQQSGSVVAHTPDALAEAQLTPGTDGSWEVVQRGPRRLWDTIEHATTAFQALGRPDRSRFGVTALDDPDRQYIWLDDPNGAHSFPLPAPRGGVSNLVDVPQR